VAVAVAREHARLRGTPWRRNAHVPAGALDALAPLAADVAAAWRDQCELHQLTGRGAAGSRRVARTIADLDDRADVSAGDIAAAIELRQELFE
jgi:magnesium chelatase family protein